jgi:hypothetical protein
MRGLVAAKIAQRRTPKSDRRCSLGLPCEEFAYRLLKRAHFCAIKSGQVECSGDRSVGSASE